MRAIEVIAADAHKRGLNPTPIIKSIEHYIVTRKGFVLQKGDTVLFARHITPKELELHLFTVDSPLRLMGALVFFVRAIRKSGVESVYGKAESPQILELLKRVGVEVHHSDKPHYNWKAVV